MIVVRYLGFPKDEEEELDVNSVKPKNRKRSKNKRRSGRKKKKELNSPNFNIEALQQITMKGGDRISPKDEGNLA